MCQIQQYLQISSNKMIFNIFSIAAQVKFWTSSDLTDPVDLHLCKLDSQYYKNSSCQIQLYFHIWFFRILYFNFSIAAYLVSRTFFFKFSSLQTILNFGPPGHLPNIFRAIHLYKIESPFYFMSNIIIFLSWFLRIQLKTFCKLIRNYLWEKTP